MATTWARKGKRPVFRRVTSDRRALSTAVALSLSGRIYKRHFDGSIKSEQVIETLQHLQRHIPGKIILIWDRARIHTSKKVWNYLSDHPEIYVEFLPAYSPELNPEEYCYGMSNKVSRMLVPLVKPKCAPGWIVALLDYENDQTYCLAFFMQQAFLLGNSG